MPEFIFSDVDSAKIDISSKRIGDNIGELSSMSNVFQCNVMTCLNPCWCGVAKQRFEQQFSVFTELFEKLVSSYRELNERLKCAGATYSKADDLARQFVAKLPN